MAHTLAKKTTTHRAILNEFLIGLMAASKQKGYKLSPGRIVGRLQIYVLNNPITRPPKGYFLSFDVRTGKSPLKGESLQWEEHLRIASREEENFDWAIILLRSPKTGFLFTSNTFEKMTATLSEGNRIPIEANNLPSSCFFYDSESFLRLLEL